ncbi:MAG: tetraacyldisaccharide 4'-kinase, partial [Muribaculaceae bacterium]|nr:tetraacyldisaccharide 4'-kinase [Muribaculaceae bacterium]
FQHRWVKPKISILLMEYGRPVYDDKLLPLGRLRESPHEINRADMVIVTKCPDTLNPLDYRIVTKNLDLMSFQKLYFSRYVYEGLKPVFKDEAKFSVNLSSFTERDSVFLLTGIAHPRYFVRHFKQYACRKKVEHFPDHHDFSRKDILRIAEKFNKMKGERKVIITTEKDAVRLVHNPYFPTELKPYVFYQPISVDMVAGTSDNDNNLIRDLLSELKLDHGDTQQTSYSADVVGGYSDQPRNDNGDSNVYTPEENQNRNNYYDGEDYD